MRTYLYIFIGGFLGSVFKFFITNTMVSGMDEIIPYHTLLINISGCFVLTFLMTLFGKKILIDEDLRLGVTTGFLGAYTTFSAISAETSHLITNAAYQEAFIYLFLTVFLGGVAVFAGSKIAGKL